MEHSGRFDSTIEFLLCEIRIREQKSAIGACFFEAGGNKQHKE